MRIFEINLFVGTFIAVTMINSYYELHPKVTLEYKIEASQAVVSYSAPKAIAVKVATSYSDDLNKKRLFWAVARTESHNKTKLKDGKIPIRFEYKTMRKCVARFKLKNVPKKLTTKQPHKDDYKLLKLAKNTGAKVSECAHWSTSFSSHQIMAFHYKIMGYDSAVSFAKAYHDNATPEFNQKMFVKFLKNYRGGKAYRALMGYRFREFAKVYNGSYAYAKKLRANYKLAKKVI